MYGLLKRPDEKYVTEQAYNNPKFVEDIVRDIALKLNDDDRIAAYIVESENFESFITIRHLHSSNATSKCNEPIYWTSPFFRFFVISTKGEIWEIDIGRAKVVGIVGTRNEKSG